MARRQRGERSDDELTAKKKNPKKRKTNKEPEQKAKVPARARSFVMELQSVSARSKCLVAFRKDSATRQNQGHIFQAITATHRRHFG